MFIVLSYKNILVNKSKLIIINILLIQTLDFFFIFSVIGEMPIVFLVAIGIYKAVVLFLDIGNIMRSRFLVMYYILIVSENRKISTKNRGSRLTSSFF